MAKWHVKAAELITNLVILDKEYPAVVPYRPGKTVISSLERKSLHRSSPEKHGIHSKRLYNMLNELENEPAANVHSIIVVKNGEVICEASAPGYSPNIAHLSHSMSKTVTGMAIGLLCDEGLLSIDTRLVDIFPEYSAQDKRFKHITVKHLLTMSTGVQFSEAGSVTESEWTKAFFGSRLDFTPGTMFAYNSMNSYMLARIVVKLSGQSMCDYLRERLFSPLGIYNFFWEIGPEGVEKGGWGLYMSAESWAKLGVMMLGGGKFHGKRILPAKWVEDSTTVQSQAPENAGDFNYGYQLWVNRSGDEFLFNGMLGQNVWVCPGARTVVVINSENSELFQKSPALKIIRAYLSAGSSNAESGHWLGRLREKEKNFFKDRVGIIPLTPKRGLTYRLGLRSARPFDTAWEPLLGTYRFAKNNHSIIPFFIRVMHNNYTGGIEAFKLEREGERLYMTSREGGISYKLEIGLYEFKSSVLNVNGEKFIVSAIGSASLVNGTDYVYKISLALPEMPNSRKIKISLKNGKISVSMSENPGEKLAAPMVDAIYTTAPKLAFAVSMLEKRLGDKFVNRKLESLFSPKLTGAKTDSSNYNEIIAKENQKAIEAKRSSNMIAAMLSKFAKDSEA